MTEQAVNEAQLHAYVDGALGEAERAVVESHLQSNPVDAERVRAYVSQNDALHRAFDAVLVEAHSLAVPVRRPVARSGRWPLALAATFAGGLVVGAVVHAVWSGQRAAAAATAISRQAVLAHVAYVPEVRHPVEVAAAEEQHLVAWLSKRLGTTVRAPSLVAAGYRLLGGRLLPPAGEADAAPVALFMYEDGRGKRLTLLVRREPTVNSTAFSFARQGETNVFFWIDGPLGYALAGEISKDELSEVALAFYRQLNP
jgi:anti-sigma factor RsiW